MTVGGCGVKLSESLPILFFSKALIVKGNATFFTLTSLDLTMVLVPAAC